MRYFIQFTGGLESSVMLHELLNKDPTGVYDILFLQPKRPNNVYWAVQLFTTTEILKEFRSRFSKATLSFNTASITEHFPGKDIRDSSLYCLFTSLLINKHAGCYSSILNGTSANLETFQEFYWKAAYKMLDLYSDNISIKMVYPLMNIPRATVYKRLPKFLGPLIWSCTNPIIKDNNAYPCEKCSKCAYNRREGLIHNIKDITPILQLLNKWKEFEKEQEKIMEKYNISLIGDLA